VSVVVANAQDEIVAVLTGVAHPDNPAEKLFGTPARVFHQPETISYLATPLATVAYPKSSGEERPATTKLSEFMELEVGVIFAAVDLTGNLRQAHGKAVGAVKDAFMANRGLNGKAIDVHHLGGDGVLEALEPVEAIETSGEPLYRGVVRLRVHVRHAMTDSTQQV
jgi:hypothetical protein